MSAITPSNSNVSSTSSTSTANNSSTTANTGASASDDILEAPIPRVPLVIHTPNPNTPTLPGSQPITAKQFMGALVGAMNNLNQTLGTLNQTAIHMSNGLYQAFAQQAQNLIAI